ncbi:MAG: GHMP kinase [Lachnospiraceae bacterium]|nr:GHMP kinase [Lachnospiraceae bacterium]
MNVFTPYRVCPLGAHVDHQHGIVTGFALDKGVSLEFEPTEDGTVQVFSKNFPGEVSFSIFEELEREMNWGDFVKGAVVTLLRKYQLTRGIKGTIVGTLPIGGLSSSAAVIITYLNALCKANDIMLTRPELISLAIWEERNYIGVNVGKLDQSCEVYCKENSLLVLDTKDDASEIIPVNRKMPEFEIMIIFSGLERRLAGSAYNTRVDECKSAAYALMAFSEMEYGKYQDTYLRDVPYGIYEEHKHQLPRLWRKRAKHYYSEQKRVKDGVKAWRAGDLEKFGQLIFESGRSSIENYETGSKELAALQEIMESVEGIYGGRFSGAGFNGSSMALIDPTKRESIAEYVTSEYLKRFPELEGKFSITFCKTADGVKM